MFFSSCLAYKPVKICVKPIEDHVNFKLEDEQNGNSLNLTLSGQQAATLATALIDMLLETGERPDPFNIYGKAKIVREAA